MTRTILPGRRSPVPPVTAADANRSLPGGAAGWGRIVAAAGFDPGLT